MADLGKILIIDDDNDLRSVLKDVLSGEGFSVSEASDGNSGITPSVMTHPMQCFST
jgi:DNA-binding response OmpR family regulator